MAQANLTDKEDRFIDQYMIDLNGTKAALSAGYSEKSARQLASRLLSKVNIQDEIAKRRKALKEKFSITFEDKQRWLAEIVQYGTGEEIVFVKGRDEEDDPEHRQRNPSSAVSAIKELNMMDGDHATIKSTVTVSTTDSLNEYLSNRGK